jgi:hypothetical protein
MKHSFFLYAAAAALALAGCNSTSVESTYTSPKATTPFTFKKVLVVAITSSPGLRRTAEEAMAANISPAQPVRSYEVFPEEMVKNNQAVAAKMRELGIDGIITLRPLYNRQEIQTYNTGSYPYPYRSYYGYSGYGWGAAYGGTEITVDEVVGIETNIYTAQTAELIWSGMTKSVNAGNTTSLINDVAKTVRKELEKKGLIAPQPKK